MIDECPVARPTWETVRSVDAVLYYTWEREAIRLARENGHTAPYTSDPILARYKFTNVRRRDDRVSRWIIENLIEPAVDNVDEYLWFTLLIARLINWPPSLRALIDAGVLPTSPSEFDAEEFIRVVEGCKADGKKVYSGAYMVYPTRAEPSAPKSRLLAERILSGVIANSEAIHRVVWLDDTLSVRSIVEILAQCFGISTFMAGQATADLTYTGLEFSDLYTYAPIGPGSSRGLNYLFNRAPGAGWGQDDFNRKLIDIRGEIIVRLEIEDLTLHDVQNVMCEYSKYARAVLGEGMPKNLYTPEQEF